MESKNIERLYQEKLKDLELNPSDAVWQKIEQSLAPQQSTKKRIFPYWFVAGLVAILCIGFFLFPLESKINTSKNHIAQTTQQQDTLVKRVKQLPKPSVTSANNNPISEKTSITQHIVTKTTQQKNSTHLTKKNASPTTEKLRIIQSKKTTKKDFLTTSPNTKSTSRNIIPKQKDSATTDTPKKDLVAEITTPKEKPQPRISKKLWSVAPTLSQYITGALSNNSPLDEQLNSAEKTGRSSTSFGINLAYQANPKLKFRTGIHQINLTQTTLNNNLNSFNNSLDFIEVENVRSNNPTSSDEIVSDAPDISEPTNPSNKSNESINSFEQSLSYIEIPLEINVNIYTKNKFQLYVLGGMSTLFLTENNLSFVGNQSTTNGSATNINNLNFSFNLGTSFEYHFSNKWFLNVNPGLKIQTKTFRSRNNNPYLLGVSTGLNYKF